MSYLLDTNSMSYFMEQRTSIRTKVREVGGLSVLSTSTITVAELYYGVMILPEGHRKANLLTSLENVLGGGIEVRPFSGAAAKTYAEAGAALRRAGVRYSFQDLAIASVALAEDRTVASNDRFFKHAQRVCGLMFERWEP